MIKLKSPRPFREKGFISCPLAIREIDLKTTNVNDLLKVYGLKG